MSTALHTQGENVASVKGTYGRVYLGMNAMMANFVAAKEMEVNPKVAQGDENKMRRLQTQHCEKLPW